MANDDAKQVKLLKKSNSELKKQLQDARKDIKLLQQKLGVKPTESKMLGLRWNKKDDTLRVIIEQTTGPVTKRNILSCLAKVYNPLGIASPLTLTGKQIYRDVCDSKVHGMLS